MAKKNVKNSAAISFLIRKWIFCSDYYLEASSVPSKCDDFVEFDVMILEVLTNDMIVRNIISGKFSARAAVLNAHAPILVLLNDILFQRNQRHFARKNSRVIVRNLILYQCCTRTVRSNSKLLIVFNCVVFQLKFRLNI
jgi:hypothetical protein